MKHARVADDAHEEVIEEVLEVEHAMIFFELWIVCVTIPEDAEVDVQPQCHDIAGDHSLRQQRTHVCKDVVRWDDLIGACQVQAHVAQEEAQQTVHRVDQLAPILEHHTLFHLPWKEYFSESLAAHPGQGHYCRPPARLDRKAVWEGIDEVIPEARAWNHKSSGMHHHDPIEIVDCSRNEESPKACANVAIELADGTCLLADDLAWWRRGLCLDSFARSGFWRRAVRPLTCGHRNCSTLQLH
mmetsp:Transcript_117058/g.164565  ORF Transcript_117058/g.164565 Transcript_117058/m.164565 type:complete len:242 (-) Transcript_117058:21-746(-)